MNNKIPDEFVTYEEAELLYKCKFNVVCIDTYEKILLPQTGRKTGEVLSYSFFNNNTDNMSLNARTKKSFHCSRPLRETALEWIRINYGIYVSVLPEVLAGYFYIVSIQDEMGIYKKHASSNVTFSTPSDAKKHALIKLLTDESFGIGKSIILEDK